MNRDEAKPTGLFGDVFRTCRQRARNVKVADATGQELSGGALLARALVARRLLRRAVLGADERRVGVFLPPSVGAVVANLALALDRRVVVNLNYTLSGDLLAGCLTQANIAHVLTSRRVTERFPLPPGARPVFLEDLAPAATRIDKAVTALLAFATPIPVALRSLGLDHVAAGDVMTVIFTSGSTGAPKGVELSYGAVTANLDAVDHLMRWRRSDVVLGVLPFFHAFGSTMALWGPLTRDIEAAYIANPLDAHDVGRLCRERRATVLGATPTFLRSYLRRCAPADLASLDVVAVGAERLPPSLSDAFADTFGVRPVEGYGMTEMAPLVAANIPPARATAGDPCPCAAGAVGRPVRGARAKIVDPESWRELGPDEPGLLLATGPSLMNGYLGQPAATAAAMRDGWYVTGDIASIDPSGCIRIVDRQSRFAKIAGEMVPFAAIENALNGLHGADDGSTPKFAVTAVADAIKGERLVVVHAPVDQTPDELRKGLAAAGLPNLFIPGRDCFLQIDELPLNGAGKLDLAAIKRIARDAAAPAGVA